MSKTLNPPYLKSIGHRGKISIWTVDGTYVRTHLDEELTNHGQHYAFKCVPKNEFWLDKEAEKDEQRFFIDHLLTEHTKIRARLSIIIDTIPMNCIRR